MSEFVFIQPTPDAPLHSSTGPAVPVDEAVEAALSPEAAAVVLEAQDEENSSSESEQAPVVDEPVSSSSTETNSDSTSSTPSPSPSPSPKPSTEKTLYKHVGDNDIDSSVWPDANVKDSEGNELYTFVNDTQTGDAKGASDEWVVSKAA